MTQHRLLLLGAISLLALVESQAAEKEFLLSGTRWRLEDVTAETVVQFQSLRTNRTMGVWNVWVSLTNTGTRDLYTPLVLSIDSYSGTTGPTDADGYDEEFPPKPFYNLSSLQPDSVLLPGHATQTRTLSLGGGGIPQLIPRVFAWIPPPEFRITDIVIPPDGKPLIHHTADTNFYYILLAGNQITNISSTAGMALPSGTNGLGQLNDFASAFTNSARFYRVRKVPIAQPLDSDGDGIDDIWELNHASQPESLNPLDPTDGSRTGSSGRTLLEEYLSAKLSITSIAESSPANGESGVSVTRETIFRFNHPLAPSTILNTNHLCACFGGRQILSRIELSSDRKKVTLFYQEPLPASARIRVTFTGSGLTDYLGRALDLDGDGQPGGNAIVDFDTLSITPVAKTAVMGHVYASVQIPVVSTNTTTNFVDHPLPGVLISVIGAEQEIFTTTDAQGFFRLTNCPAGKFFVSIDGRTSPESSWPNGAYYPLVGKPWEAVAGRTNNLAGGTGLIYLPLVQAGTLQPVNPTADTTIGFPPEVIAANPAWAGVSVTIPTNALYSDNGTRGGRVGLAPVPADRLPERLPAGIVHALDISIQTDGPQNVDRPLPVRFPNLPDSQTGLKLPPGAKSALMSYNHDTGRWEVQGPMTVTADGNYVETDPGVGVRQPGWHGVMPGVGVTGGPLTGCNAGGGCTDTCNNNGSLTGGSVTAGATEVCVGSSISFSASGVTDSGGEKTVNCPCDPPVTKTISPGSIQYEWKISRDGSVVASGSGSSATYSPTNGEAGVYTCQFTAKANRECPPTDITLPPGPSVTVSGLQSVDAQANGFSNQSSQCQNTPVSFSAQVQQINCGTLTYSWNFGDGSPEDTTPNPTHQFPDFGDYTVTLTVSCTGTACSDTKSDSVGVHIREVQSVDAKANGQDAATVFVGDAVSFTATTTPPNYTGVDFDWNFGDGSIAHGSAVSHAYQANGTYTATVTAACTSGGTPRTDSVTVTVTNSCATGTVTAVGDTERFIGVGQTDTFAVQTVQMSVTQWLIDGTVAPNSTPSLSFTPPAFTTVGIHTVTAVTDCPGKTVVFTVHVIVVGITAFRPTTEGQGYGHPFQRWAVPEGQEESPGAGIRVNGNNDNNNLVEVEVNAPLAVSSGFGYVLKRSSSSIKVWTSQNKTSLILGANDEAVLSIVTSPISLWVENPAGGEADLEIQAKMDSGTIIGSDKVHFYPFSSVVVLFVGENQTPSDPPAIGGGISALGLSLYLSGYDVHVYDEPDPQDIPNTELVALREIYDAFDYRSVSTVALIGYSHGGGSVYNVSFALSDGLYNLAFSAYIDAVAQPLANIDPETRRPVFSAFHVNYYQVADASDLFLDGAPTIPLNPGVDGFELNLDASGNTESHISIDDSQIVQQGIRTRFFQHVNR